MAKTRGNGDGSFREMKNGRWEYTVSIGVDRQRKRFYGVTKTECKAQHKKFLKEGEKAKAQPVKRGEYTLAEWLDVWLTTYKKGTVSDGTYDDYVSLASHAQRHKIGNMKLSKVKPIDVTEYFADYADYSHSFHKRMIYVLRAAFEEALDNDYCPKNPVRKIKPKGVPQEEKEAFTEEEVEKILSFAKTDKLFGLAMYIMLNTGIRPQEMRALTVGQFDFEDGILKIDRAIKRNGELGLPKNNKPRIVTLEPHVAEYLLNHIDRNVNYIVGDKHYVTKCGFESRYKHFSNRLNKHLAAIGEPPINMRTPHIARHTASTLWQANGMSRELAGELLGHGSVEVTNGYTHTQLKTLKEAVKNYGISGAIA